jgi:hypothetical protein
MSIISVSRLCEIVMDFDVHLLRKTNSLIGILDRIQRLRDRVKEEANLLSVDSAIAVLPLYKRLELLSQRFKVRRTDIVTAFLCCRNPLPGLALDVETRCVPHKGILSIFLCSQERSASGLKTLL